MRRWILHIFIRLDNNNRNKYKEKSLRIARTPSKQQFWRRLFCINFCLPLSLLLFLSLPNIPLSTISDGKIEIRSHKIEMIWWHIKCDGKPRMCGKTIEISSQLNGKWIQKNNHKQLMKGQSLLFSFFLSFICLRKSIYVCRANEAIREVRAWNYLHWIAQHRSLCIDLKNQWGTRWKK